MSHKGHEMETGLKGNVNELKKALHHTTKDDVHEVEVKRTPTGKAIYAESVAPIEKPCLPEKIQFPELMTPELHLERAKYYREEAEKWRNKHYGKDEGLNAKKYVELTAKARYHEGMAAQPQGLKVPKEHPDPVTTGTGAQAQEW